MNRSFSYRPIFDFRRFPLKACVFAILAILVATWPCMASANPVIFTDGLTKQQREYYDNGGYANDIYQSRQIGQEDYVKTLMNEDYVKACNKNSNPATSKSTTFDEALKTGKTTYYDSHTGKFQRVSDQQKFMSGGNLKAKDIAKVGRYNSTSSSIAEKIKKRGKASSVLAASKNSGKSLISKVFGVGGKLIAGAGKFLGTVAGITMVRDLTNGVISFFDSDRFDECMASSDIMQQISGMADYCSEISTIPQGLPNDVDLSDFPCFSFKTYSVCLTRYHQISQGANYSSLPVFEYTVTSKVDKNIGVFTGLLFHFDSGNDFDVNNVLLDTYNDSIIKLGQYSEGYKSFIPYLDSVSVGQQIFVRIAFRQFTRYSDDLSHYNNEFDDALSAILSGNWTYVCPASNVKKCSYDSNFKWIDKNGNETDERPKHDDLTKKVGTPDPVTTTVDGSDGKQYTATNTDTDRGTIPSPTLPAGVSPVSVTVTAKKSDGTTQTIIPKTNVTDPKTPEVSGTLDLIDTATGNSCYGEGYACADWPTKVKEATKKEVNTDNKETTKTVSDMPFKCVWAGDDGSTKELPIGECTVLRKQWQPKHTKDGTTAVDPTDPDTDIKDPIDAPQPSDRPSYTDCVKEDISWNPVTWVFTPVKCALDWAFVPSKTNTKTQAVLVRQKVSTTYIDSLIDAFKSAFLGRQELTEAHCLGPEFHLEFMGYQLIPKGSHPLSVCEGSGFEFLPEFSKATCLVLATAVSFLTLRKWIAQAVHFNDDKNTDIDK